MKNDQQERARELYFHTNKTQQEIADILDVNRRTVYLWIKQGRWDEMKTAARQMPLLIQQHIYNHITAVNDQISKRNDDNRCPTMQEVEKLRKLINMTNTIKKQSTGAYMEAFQELYQFVFNRDSIFAKELSGHIQAYTRGTMGDKEFMTRKQRKDNVLEVVSNLAKEEMRNNAQPQSGIEDHAPQQETVCNEQDKNAIFCDKNCPIEAPGQPHKEITIAEGSHTLADASSGCQTHKTCDTKGIFCDKNGIYGSAAENQPKPLRTKDYVGFPCPIDEEKYPIPGNFDFKTVSFLFDDKAELTFNEIMKLPIAFRPSPFMDGDIVWVKEMDDVESPLSNFGLEWGTLKMGHTVRRYPDIDTAAAA